MFYIAVTGNNHFNCACSQSRQATRVLQALPGELTQFELNELGVSASNLSEQIIWQTSEQAFSYQLNPNINIINNVVMKVVKPAQADYVGFGEQGGRTVMKKPTYMNYFCKPLATRLLWLQFAHPDLKALIILIILRFTDKER
jgi:hypothetical protein